jgi:dolichol-phosphate mannosyltransferase
MKESARRNDAPSEGNLVSIVVPAYNEEENINNLMRTLMSLDRNKLGDMFEFVIVDDGSTDRTWDYLCRYLEKEPRLTLLKLAGNKGSPVATRAGLAYSRGAVCIALSADLEEGIDLIEPCLAEWYAGKTVVMVVPRGGRQRQGVASNLFAWIFYKLLRSSSSLYGGLDVRAFPQLMDRIAVDTYVRYAPNSNNRAVFFLQQGFRYGVVHYALHKRRHGKSKWTFARRVKLALDTFVDASSWMLSSWRLSLVGLGVFFGIRLLTELAGWGGRSIDVWLELALFGLLLLTLNLMGLFVVRSHQELRTGPAYVVEKICRSFEDPS